MEPVISPWVVYLVGTIGSIRGCFIAAAAILCGAAFMTSVIAAIYSSERDADTRATAIALLRKFRIGIPIVLISILMPSQKTVIGMIVASEITEDRVVKAGELALDLREYIKADILDIITAVKEEAE